jgi:hypothetical protein
MNIYPTKSRRQFYICTAILSKKQKGSRNISDLMPKNVQLNAITHITGSAITPQTYTTSINTPNHSGCSQIRLDPLALLSAVYLINNLLRPPYLDP